MSMDTNFTFPRPQAPTLRPVPPSGSSTSSTSGSNPVNRESNALRASVLDAALQLGIGTNSTVANWMFNNSLPEEDEEDLRSPALTYGSTATSEESAFSGRHAQTSSSSQGPSNPKPAQAPDTNLFPVPEGHIRFDASVDLPIRPEMDDTESFRDIPIPPRPVTPVRGKLRKKRGDGYESDGGYMSDVGKKKKDKDRKKSGSKEANGGSVNVEAEKKERAKEAKIRAKEEKLQEKKEKEEERKRKKSMSKVKKGQAAEDKDGYATGYETDSTPVKGAKSLKNSKSKASGDAGYETDSGYLSSTSVKSKSKSRFFRLGSKQSKPNLQQEEVPAMPVAVIPTEPVPLPIASRFATTIMSPSSSASGSLNNVSTTLMDPPPMPPVVAFPPAPPPTVPTTTAVHSPTSPTVITSDHRESYGSAESGGSFSASSNASHSKRRGIQFFGRESSHGHGSGSHSTITSASQVPLPQSAVSSPSSPSKTHPAISLPLTHTTSLSPTRGAYSPSNLGPSSNQPSPSSIPNSSAILSPPIIPTSRNPSPIPGLTTPRPQFLQATSPSPTGSASSSPRPRPRFPPIDGFGPRLTPSESPIPFLRSPSPFLRSPSRQDSPGGDRPTLTIVPSTSYIVPSPRGSPLPSPNVLAYYDIPPPSPPPAGPLPNVPMPPPGNFTPARTRTLGPDGGTSASNTSSISRSRTPEQGLFSQPIPSIQRGREAPFPARPILPGAMQGLGSTPGSGLEARVKVPRYRELYGLALPQPREQERRAGWHQPQEREHEHEQGIDVEVIEPSDGGWEDVGYDEQDEEDMRDVLERFEEARISAEGRERQKVGGTALGRNQSFEAIRNRISDRGGNGDGDGMDSDYKYDDEDADAGGEAEERRRKLSTSTEEGGDRTSRWSGSIYSRVSVLDPEKSEEARQRFVKRVEDLYGDGGREKVIPPVPKIPDAFVGAAPGRFWNRF